MQRNDREYISVEFHNRAKNTFFSLYMDFQSSVTGVNRRKSEYLFQQLKEKYVHTLKQELEMIAKEIMKKSPDPNQTGEVDQNLNHFINDYLHRFVQKIKDS